MSQVPVRAHPALPGRRGHGGWLLAAGAVVFGAAVSGYTAFARTHPKAWTLDPVDLGVYRSGGLIVRHVTPPYDPRLAAPLYDWGGYHVLHLKFTYPPIAAIVFAAVSLVPWAELARYSEAVNTAALVAAVWFTFGGLGYRRGMRRLGATLLVSGVVFLTEPVLRTIYLGQVNLVLMALILWDLCQPDTRATRWWKGAGVGIAAGIKLIPLIFIPYLLATRRYRQAVMACAGFAGTVLIGFAVLPRDSALWWFHGLFASAGRTGFAGWLGNQSLRGIITRLAGSVAGATPWWLAAAVLVALLGIGCAAALDRAGHPMAGLLCCALTGLLASPVSWDHHWVWVAPGVAVAGHYAARAWPAARKRAVALWVLAGGIAALYAAWPATPAGPAGDHGGYFLGVIWTAPYVDPAAYLRHGDQPWYPEYHWHGLQLIAGNAFVLGGLAVLAVLLTAAARTLMHAAPGTPGQAIPAGGGDAHGDRSAAERARSHG